MIHGFMAWVNWLIPVILVNAWIANKNDYANHKLYTWAWYMFEVLHSLMYIWPSLLFLLTLVGRNTIDYLFVNWFTWTYQTIWGIVALNGLLFVISIFTTESTASTPWWEVMFSTILYLCIGGADIYISIIYYDFLKNWYPFGWSDTSDNRVPANFTNLDSVPNYNW